MSWLYTQKPHQLPVAQKYLTATMRARAAEHNFYCAFFENAVQAYAWLRDQQKLEPISAGLMA